MSMTAEKHVSESQLLTAEQVARLLAVSVKTVRRMTRRGELPRPVRIGRQVRWRLADIERFIKRLGANGGQ